jgi:type VI protein secretion system component Hcp
MESVSFDYGEIEWTYTQQRGRDGSGGGGVTGGAEPDRQ